jgi:hypothetical protein
VINLDRSGSIDLLADVARPPTIGAAGSHRDGSVKWWALACAGLAPVVMISAWIVADAAQSESYSPMRETVSILSGYAATDRWIVTGALLVVGVLYVLTAVGVAALRMSARIGLVVAGAASIGIAACPEPVVGSTTEHMVCTSVGATAIAVWPILTVRRSAPESVLVSGPVVASVTVIFVVLLGWMVIETQGGQQLGLAERTDSSIQIVWPFVVAWALWRRRR